MNAVIRYLLGSINITQEGNLIKIGGIRSKLLMREIRNIFGTGIERGMFYNTTYNRIEIPLFFAFDFLETLKTVLEFGTFKYYNKNLIEKIVEELWKTPIFQKVKAPVEKRFNRKKLDNFYKSPLTHQLKFFDNYERSLSSYGLKGYVLGSPPGTGKTMMACYCSEMLEYKRTIVFSPNNALVDVWYRTFQNEFRKTPSSYIHKHTELRGDERFLVFNHEALPEALEIIKKHVKKGTANVVIDESHAFTDMKSDRTNLLIQICNHLACEDVLFMSGTPFKALGSEIIPFLHIADPLFNDRVKERFKKVFGVNGLRALPVLAARIGRSLFTIDKKSVVDNKRIEFTLKIKLSNGNDYTLDALRTKMQKFIIERVEYYQREKFHLEQEYLRLVAFYEAGLKDRVKIRELQTYRKNVELIRSAKDLRNVLEIIKGVNNFERREIIPSLSNADKKIFRDVRTVYKYVALKIQGEALGRILGKERGRCNVDLFLNLDNALATCPELDIQDEPWTVDDIFSSGKAKTIFFTDYVEVIEVAKDYFKKRKMNPEVVYGDTNKDLDTIMNRIKNDPKANPTIATYKSLSTAVPLTFMDSCIFLNAPFRDYIRNQAESRLDRIGQENLMRFYTVLLDTGDEPNISTRSKEILEWSKEMVGKLTGTQVTDDDEVTEENFIENFDQTPTIEVVKPRYAW